MKSIAAALSIGCVFILTGCLPQARVIWSPDGEHAAVLGDNGLSLCNADGQLTGPFTDKPLAAAWMDNRQLVVAEAVEVASLDRLHELLGEETLQQSGQYVQPLFEAVMAHQGPWDQFKPDLDAPEHLLSLAIIQMRDAHGEQLQAKLPADQWSLLNEFKATLAMVQVYDLGQDSTLTPACRIVALADTVHSLTLNPQHTLGLVAMGESGLAVFPLTRDAQPMHIDGAMAAFPDFTAGGQGILFVQGIGVEDDKPVFGEVIELQVADRDDQLLESPGAQMVLLTVRWHESARIRAIDANRFLLTSPMMALPGVDQSEPATAGLFDARHDQSGWTLKKILEVDRQTAPGLDAFALSPDKTRLAYITREGRTALLRLSDQSVQVIQDRPLKKTSQLTRPTWRGSDQVCLIRPGGDAEASNEVALWKNGTIRILSEGWPDAVRRGWLNDSKSPPPQEATTRPADEPASQPAAE